MEEKYEVHTLSNGIRLVHRRVDSKVAHCGLIINTGSRDEMEDEWGIAHFIEHTIFKGTTKRKSFHILSRLENVGGDLNAYTTKEETCVHAAFLSQYYDRTLELISDITFNSVFPYKELEKEKEVVIDEINSYKDSPSELIFDDFEDQIFHGYPIGKNILGSPELVKSFDKEKILKFMDRAYNTDEMVISSVGNISFKKLVRIVEKYFAPIPANPRKFEREVPVNNKIEHNVVDRGTYQSHCIMGSTAYTSCDEKRIPLGLLTNILGGPGLNSRLNLNLREKHGLAYNVEANFSPYTDTGVFNIYFGCDSSDLKKCLSICKKEMLKLRDKKLGILQFRTAKQQLLGQLALSSENNENLMLSIGKSMLLYNRVDTLDKIYHKIEAITADQLLEVANEIFNQDNMSTLIYK